MEEVDGQSGNDTDNADTSPILDEKDLLARWKLPYESENDPAFKKLLYRLRTAKGKKHLASLPLSKKRYRLVDVEAWEARNARNVLLAFAEFADDDLDELDPAAGTGKTPNYP